MGSLLVLYGCWQVCGWSPVDRPLVGDVFFYPVGVAAIWAALAASRRCAAAPRLRSAWRLLALASLAYLAGDIAQTVYELLGSLPFPSASDALYLTFYPLMVSGLMLFGAGRRSAAERVRIGLDLAVVAIGSSAVVLYLVLGPVAVAAGPRALETVVSIAYPVGDMVLLVGFASLVMRQASPSARLALRFTAIGLTFFVAADVIYGYINLHSSYQGGDPVDAFWMVAIAFFAVSGAAQATPKAAPPSASQAPRRRAAVAPYLASAVGFGLFIFVERRDAFFPNLSLAITAVLLAVLVSTRQFLAQRDLLQTQGQLSHQSLHDALTGLPNRVLVFDRAEQMLARARRARASAAALYIDIDGFKQVNDRYGHAAGDELLRIVAARLRDAVRESDTVGRLGGDEFAVLLGEPAVDVGTDLVAERLLKVLHEPIALASAGGRVVAITASIGIATGCPSTAEELLRDADLALYEAKASGKNRSTVFETRMQTASLDRLELEMDLDVALEEGQFFLLYQPIFDLVAQRIRGVEALIRWRRPSRGVVAPETFIPVAEDTGSIVAIGRWVLLQACLQARQWRERDPAFCVSVNVSARQFEHDELIDDVSNALSSSGLDPGSLTLEITETTLMRDASAAAGRLRRLKELGVQIAVDDFGTGYSSLAYLRQFPVDAIKIDRSFISGTSASLESSDGLIHTLVQLGKTLGLTTVGEGIEDRDQLQRLQREHCDLGQGFLLARPLEAAAVDGLLEGSQGARVPLGRAVAALA